MTDNRENNPATHFGKQMRKERLAHGLTLRAFAAATGVDIGQASRIENGKRPPNERVAMACDAIFPARNGWFLEYYSELGGWAEVPATFRDWTELELNATRLHVWQPGIVHGLLQVEDYAKALISVEPRVTPDAAVTRLSQRMERQRRILLRDEPPSTWFIIDELCLYREVGSATVMAEQVRRLREVAALPGVTMQVLPGVQHCANASAFIIADNSAAYVEHLVSGYVFADDDTVTDLAEKFDSLRSECYRASDTAALLEKVEGTWTTGGSRVIRAATAVTA
jgi:transcriptional regulator with XRE-family HTH domain